MGYAYIYAQWTFMDEGMFFFFYNDTLITVCKYYVAKGGGHGIC